MDLPSSIDVADMTPQQAEQLLQQIEGLAQTLRSRVGERGIRKARRVGRWVLVRDYLKENGAATVGEIAAGLVRAGYSLGGDPTKTVRNCVNSHHQRKLFNVLKGEKVTLAATGEGQARAKWRPTWSWIAEILASNGPSTVEQIVAGLEARGVKMGEHPLRTVGNCVASPHMTDVFRTVDGKVRLLEKRFGRRAQGRAQQQAAAAKH